MATEILYCTRSHSRYGKRIERPAKYVPIVVGHPGKGSRNYGEIVEQIKAGTEKRYAVAADGELVSFDGARCGVHVDRRHSSGRMQPLVIGLDTISLEEAVARYDGMVADRAATQERDKLDYEAYQLAGNATKWTAQAEDVSRDRTVVAAWEIVSEEGRRSGRVRIYREGGQLRVGTSSEIGSRRWLDAYLDALDQARTILGFEQPS